MEEKYYEVAGVSLCIRSQFQTKDTPVTAPFLCQPREHAHMCHVFMEDKLNEPMGNVCFSEELMTVYRDGKTTYRRFVTGTQEDKIYMLSKITPGEDAELRMLRSELGWCSQMGYIFLALGLGTILLEHERLVLHASVVETKQGAILFTASSGTGKSTQAGLWQKYRNAEIINGDRCAVGLLEGKSMVFGVPMAGTSGISQNKTMPIRGIVVLEQAPENRIRQLHGAEALLRAGFGAVINRWEPKEKNVAMDILSRIMEQTPVFLLQCLPEEGAVDTLENALEALE